MTDSLTSCPMPEQLRALVDGTLPESDQANTQTHVDGCGACQQVLESLVQGSESWDSALGHLRNEPAGTRETVLSEAIKQMKAEEFVESADPGWQSRRPLDFLTPSDVPGSIGKLGAYEVTEVIGQGGMGVVLKAFDPALHRVVAVKVLAPYLAHNPQARKRFVREAQAIAAVSHDHVITIHAIDESAEQPKIVMQYVAGCSLQQKIDAEGSLDLKEILRIGMQTASGLAAAHAQGLVHRDVKPSNILLENGIQRVKLTDFGLARAVDDASLTQSGAIAGTPQYMAPEQANGDGIDYRADLFSLGSVMYAMCVGHSPFRASTTMGVLKRVCHDPPRPIQELNADIPDWLCAIVMKLLSKKPEDRFQSAKAVADLLEKWLAHVQQPMVVAKPAFVVGSSSSTASVSKPTQTNELATLLKQQQSIGRELDARTILFQPISGRMLLFFLLVGMAGTLAFVQQANTSFPQSHRMEIGEAVLASVMGGLFTAFAGLLIVSLVRLIGANVYGHVPWMAKSSKARGERASLEAGRNEQRSLSGLSPESLAILAAILAMLLSIHPLIAAIIAIVVWRVAISRATQYEHNVGGAPSNAVPPDMNAVDPISAVQRFSWAHDLSHHASHLYRHVWANIGSFFSPAALDRNRIFMAIGWWLVGGVDLFYTFALWQQSSRLALIAVLSLAMSLVSFAVSHCVYVRQNSDIVRSVCFLGLLPLSFGAIGRIPLSIVTLLWQNASGTRESFESKSFPQTQLGSLLRGFASSIRRSIGTASLTALWTLSWGAFVAGVVWLWVLPYGPSSYQVYDKAKIKLKGQPNAQYLLTASGSGSGVGLIPPTFQAYRPQEVKLEVDGKNALHRLKVLLGGRVAVNESTYQILTKSDVDSCLWDSDIKNNHPQHAANLMEIINRLNSSPGFTAEKEAPQSLVSLSYSERMRISMDMWQRRITSQVERPWPGFTRLSSMLDPELFEISPDHDLSSFDCYPAIWFSVAGGIVAFLIWLVITGWIVKRRHFRRAENKPLDVAMASP